jgi:NAD(P)H-dependent flavin oxidoreductase YrpB (nitropropane dioxygenase family)
LPSAALVARVRGWGSKILASATTVEEALWLEAHGADIIVAQGLEAGGHRGIFLSDAFPLATSAIAPLRAKAESQGSGDFSPLWSGQNASGCKEIPAARLTRELARFAHSAAEHGASVL